MTSLLKMLLWTILYKLWADFAKRRGMYWKSTAHLRLHKDGSCGVCRIGNNGMEYVEGFPWLMTNTKLIVKWFISEFKEISKEHRPHHEILSSRMRGGC